MYILQPKKKEVFLFYMYNFYFKNLIYKWIKQFKNNKRAALFFKQYINES